MRDVLGDIRGRAAWVVFACLICQIGVGFNYGLSPLAPDMLAEFGWSRALFSSLQWPQGVVIAFASPAMLIATITKPSRAIVVVIDRLAAISSRSAPKVAKTRPR